MLLSRPHCSIVQARTVIFYVHFSLENGCLPMCGRFYKHGIIVQGFHIRLALSDFSIMRIKKKKAGDNNSQKLLCT